MHPATGTSEEDYKTSGTEVMSVLTVHRIGAGDGYRYYTRMVPAADEGRQPGERLSDYYARSGEAPGVWLGRGAKAMNVAGPVHEQQLAYLLGLGMHPDTGEQLGTAYRIFATVEERVTARLATMTNHSKAAVAAMRAEEERKGERQAVAGFDLTFSPVKSISVAWGLAAKPVAEQLLAAHRAAVLSTITWLEDEVIVARAGADGLAHVDVAGVTVAAFEHRTSRAGDPDLHTHAVVSNKVLATLHDGTTKWLTIDSRSLYKATVTASERYNQLLADEVTRRLGWTFVVRSDQAIDAVAPIRELSFMPEPLIAAFSRRRAQIEAGYIKKVTDYRRRHGHEPPRHVQYALAQEACLADRPGKKCTRTPDEERAQWAEFAAGIVTTVEREGLRNALAHTTAIEATVDELPDEQVEQLAARVLDQLESRRSDWSIRHLTSAAHRLTAGVTFTTDTQRDAQVARVVATAIGEIRSVQVTAPDAVPVPQRLHRRGGPAIFDAPASARFSTHRLLDAEADLVTGARETVAAHVQADRLTTVLDEYELGADQRTAIEQIAAADRRLQLLVGPAGTGKTTTMRALVTGWQRAAGAPVSGLAPTAVAAAVLRAETGMDATATLDLWSWRRTNGDPQAVFRSGELVVIDEAGMAGTLRLQEILTAARADGAHVLLVGDPRQLSAIDAGGAVRLIQHDVGATQLHTVWRFSDTDPDTGKRVVRQWEADASLALRVGDHAAVDAYLAHDRVHEGTRHRALDDLYQAWLTDVDAGQDAIMIAADNATVTALAARARNDRITAGHVDPTHTVQLRGGVHAGIGDKIVTRRNDRHTLRLSRSDFVKNGDLWTVEEITPTGGLMVTGKAGRITLPATYVAAHVDLGYAVTVHRAQGLTVHTAHTLADDSLTRETLYVAATRGRAANHLYCVTEHLLDAELDHGPPHAQPARDVLTRALDRTEASESATQSIRDEQYRVTSARTHLSRWQYVMDHLAEPVAASALAVLPEHVAAQLRDDRAWPDLARCIEWLGAPTAEQLLGDAWSRRTADRTPRAGPLAAHLGRTHRRSARDGDWLPAPIADPEGESDREYANQLITAARDRAAHLGQLAAADPPAWSAVLGPVPSAGPERDAWIRRAGNIAAYRETYDIYGNGPLGPSPLNDPQQHLAWTHALTALPGHQPDPAQQTPATHRNLGMAASTPSGDLPYLHLHDPQQRVDAVRADLAVLEQQIIDLTPAPGQPGRHQQVWDIRGRALHERWEYLRPMLQIRDDADRDYADATASLADAEHATAQYAELSPVELAADIDTYLAKLGADRARDVAQHHLTDAADALLAANRQLTEHAKAGPPSPPGGPTVLTRRDLDTEQFLAADLDHTPLADLSAQRRALIDTLARAEHHHHQHSRVLTADPTDSTSDAASTTSRPYSQTTDAQLLALCNDTARTLQRVAANLRALQSDHAEASRRKTTDAPGPREERARQQISEWTTLINQLDHLDHVDHVADDSEVEAIAAMTAYETHQLTPLRQRKSEWSKTTEQLRQAATVAQQRAVHARARAYEVTATNPATPRDRELTRQRATKALDRLDVAAAADDDRHKTEGLVEQIGEAAREDAEIRKRLSAIADEATLRQLRLKPGPKQPTAATPSNSHPYEHDQEHEPEQGRRDLTR